MRPELPVVVEQTGEGQYRATVPGGLALLFSARPGDDDARIPASELARWLGYPRPRKVRELIGRMDGEGKLPGLEWRPTVGRQSAGRNGKGVREYTVNEPWLDRVQALLVATQAETPKAWEVTTVMARVFDAVLNGARPAMAPAPTAALDAATLAAVVEAAVESRLAPLRAEVAEVRLAVRPAPEAVEPWPGVGEVIGRHDANAFINGPIKRIADLNVRLEPAFPRRRGRINNLHAELSVYMHKPRGFAWAELSRADLGRAKSWLAQRERHVRAQLKRLPPMAPPFQPQLPERGT